jgi:hypothetical protein
VSARITTQKGVDARQAAEEKTYRARTERALKIVVANRPYTHPYSYRIDWQVEAATFAKTDWYVTALIRQAEAFGIEIPEELRPGYKPPAPAKAATGRPRSQRPRRSRQPACPACPVGVAA